MGATSVDGSNLGGCKSPPGWVCMNCMEHFVEAGPALTHLCPKNPSYLRGRRELAMELSMALANGSELSNNGRREFLHLRAKRLAKARVEFDEAAECSGWLGAEAFWCYQLEFYAEHGHWPDPGEGGESG